MGFFGMGNAVSLEKHEPQARLTPDGAEKLRKMEPAGWEFDVLTEVKKQEPCTVQEVARGLGRPENKVLAIMRQLQGKKYITVIR